MTTHAPADAAGGLAIQELDRDVCAREPIRTPGAVQPHGALLVLDAATLAVRQRSANAPVLLGDLLDGDVLAPRLAERLARWRDGGQPALTDRIAAAGGRELDLAAHRSGERLLVEFEPGERTETLETLYPRIREGIERMGAAPDLPALARTAAQVVRGLTGLDRVMIYRFDADWNGEVVAEDLHGPLPSYLTLRFPASDIPAQARELYLRNRLRLIAASAYKPSPIEPAADPETGEAVDLSDVGLRHVSPVHLEYMRNMGTGMSMSVSILVDGRLWGLISCHNREPRRVAAPVRNACDLLGQVLAMRIGALDRAATAAERIALKDLETELLARMSRPDDFADGLADAADVWLALADATGAAVFGDGGLRLAGDTPREEDVRALADWLHREHPGEIFHTSTLGAEAPGAERYADRASGLLAVSLSTVRPRYVLWFRPEVVRTVAWGGDPRKPVGAPMDGAPSDGVPGRLHPRASFDQWKELVRGRAAPWRPAELAAAADFRRAVIDLVLHRAEERAELSDELQRSNKELEAFSYSVSHDLRAPFRHIVGYAELLGERETAMSDPSRHYLRSIRESALSAGRLVDDLLAFSRLGRASLSRSRVDTAKLFEEVRRSLEPEWRDREVEWRVGALPIAYGDPSMLRQVLLNLVDNALKYSRGRGPAVVAVGGETGSEEIVFTVADNGVGFDMAYVDKLFGVFQRLHRAEEFEGTGIGLALARRIVERHDGRIWAEGVPGRGATFRFALPRRSRAAPPADGPRERVVLG